MKKRKKFDDGGSVMDKPNQDMRDPKYRKQLEREQALETSAPELMFVGPGMGARAGVKNLMARAKQPRKTLDVTIGQDVGKATQRGLPKELADAAREAEFLEKGFSGAAKAISRLAFDIPALENARREKFRTSPENYKKGGAVKSASSRADGIAQRGKTRGKIR